MTPTLVVIDPQNIFAAGPWGAPRFGDILTPVRRLAAAYPTVVTRFVAPAEPTGAWVDYYAAWPFALQPPDAPAYAVVDGLADLAEHTVDATTFGKWGPALDAATGGSRDLLLAGVSTDCCVLSTALAAADAGVRVRVVTDACAGASDADHDRALAAMALYAPLVTLVTSADLLHP